MAAIVRIRIDGVEQTVARISRVLPETRQAFARLARSYGRRIAQRARAAAPEDTGRLKRSTRMRGIPEPQGGAPVMVAVVSSAKHAFFVEKTPRGKEFFYPAYDREVRAFAVDVERLVSKEAKRGE